MPKEAKFINISGAPSDGLLGAAYDNSTTIGELIHG
jgi:hypothetical protein